MENDADNSQRLISIHALLAESDATGLTVTDVGVVFLSTLSLRRATVGRYSDAHARGNFYPRSPCGERRPSAVCWTWMHYFYPRSPCGERPRAIAIVETATEISIHALLAESDQSRGPPAGIGPNFYPRSPCGERLRAATSTKCAGYFYPRSPCGERPSRKRGTKS